LLRPRSQISEALQLVGERIDFAAGAVVFESLKKRKRGIYRAVPVLPAVLEMVHGLKDKKKRPAAKRKAATKKTAGAKDSPPPIWILGARPPGNTSSP